jgi:hypothetical protein
MARFAAHQGQDNSQGHPSPRTPENFIKAAFRFLLDREPKESILRQFDITVISRYFPEFERELPRYLSQF